MSTYVPLLHLGARHAFFGEQAINRFRFAPSAATAAVLARLNIVCHANTDGLTLAAPEALHRALRSGTAATAAALELEFFAWSTGASFSLVTAPAPPTASTRLLFHGACAVREGGNNWRLHAAAEADASAWQPTTIPHRAAARDDSTLSALRPAFQMVLDGAAIAAALRESTTPRFLVRFGARRTHWKYYLPSELLALVPAGSAPAIIDLDGVLNFTEAGLTELPGQRSALTFISEQAVDMRQHPPQRLQLCAQGVGSVIGLAANPARRTANRILIKRLPNASVAAVGRDVAAGSNGAGSDAMLVSEIYIR